MTTDLYRTTYHRDHSVTIWNVYAQAWIRTSTPSDRVLASLSTVERDRVLRHCDLVCCECGDATDERCEWVGPRAETVVVEWMPRWLRASHGAARNSGFYPANGALRLRVHTNCANLLIEDELGWCHAAF